MEELKHSLQAAPDNTLEPVLTKWEIMPASGQRFEEAVLQAVEAQPKRILDVIDWIRLFRGRLQGRTRLGFARLAGREETKAIVDKVKMVGAELLALHLYSGPSFVVYNSICRKFPEKILDLLKGDKTVSDNTMSTTIFCMTSGLLKLSRKTQLPEKGLVYRGLGKMLLPQQFWVPEGDPAWRGGVEKAFMSTTADRSVAMSYANGKGTVVEISVGRTQMGGDISTFSMVNISKEVLS